MSLKQKWISQSDGGVILHCFIQPKAAHTKIEGLHDGRLRVRVAAPPVDGAANEELLRFFKRLLSVKGSQLQLLRGETSRQKDVLVTGLALNAAVQLFADYCEKHELEPLE